MKPTETQLPRKFGLWTAIAVIIGQVIGVGIFLVPAGMAKAVGSPAWLFAIWLIVGVMTLCGALCYAEMAARYPEAGGSYVYLREAFGRGTAFVYGWMVLLVLDPGLTAIFGVGFASYTGFLFDLPAGAAPFVAIAVIITIGALTMLGTRVGAGFLKALTLIKIATLAFIVVFGFGSGKGQLANLQPFLSMPLDVVGALAGGFVGAFFAFAGWWEVTRIAGEIEDAERNAPRVLVLGVAGLTVIYIMTSAVFMYLVPAASVANDEAFAALAGQALFGEIGGSFFSAAVMISVAGTLFAYFLASPRVYVAMANDGLFFKYFGEVSKTFGTPLRATLIQVVLACLLVLSGSFNEILAYFFFVVILFVGVAIAGLFRIRRRSFTGYRTPWYPLPALIYLVLTLLVLVFVGMQNPLRSVIGIGVVSLGVPVYHFIFKRTYGVDKNDHI